MSDASVETQREGQVLTITQQLISQVGGCRRGEEHSLKTVDGEKVTEVKASMKKSGKEQDLFLPGACR